MRVSHEAKTRSLSRRVPRPAARAALSVVPPRIGFIVDTSGASRTCLVPVAASAFASSRGGCAGTSRAAGDASSPSVPIATSSPARSRRTALLEGIVHHLGLALGGRPGASLAKRPMLPVSNDTLLRVVRRRAQRPAEALKIVGIDDRAFRRNHRHGSIVCDPRLREGKPWSGDGSWRCCPTARSRPSRRGCRGILGGASRDRGPVA